jgi:hypothetical protein
MVQVAIVCEVRAAPAARRRQWRNEVLHRVVLTAQRDRPGLARQADERLAREHLAGRSLRAVVQVEALFQREDGLHAAAQVFDAAQAEAVFIDRAAADRPLRMAADVARVRDARVQRAV